MRTLAKNSSMLICSGGLVDVKTKFHVELILAGRLVNDEFEAEIEVLEVSVEFPMPYLLFNHLGIYLHCRLRCQWYLRIEAD